jgi:hypothetical protein
MCSMKSAVGIILIFACILITACTSTSPYTTGSAQAAYGGYTPMQSIPDKPVKMKKAKRLRYSNGRGGTYGYSGFLRKKDYGG